MRYGGILDLSTVDFPKKLCAVVFFVGCPFRCPYCQNYRLFEGGVEVTPEEIAKKIRENYLIEGVCLTGGEPLVQNLDELTKLIELLKEYGLAVKLDTNGYYPEKLRNLVDRLDYVAMDFKTVPEKYAEVTGKKDSFEKFLESLKILVDSGIDFEIRTTVVPTITDEDDLIRMGEILASYGVEKFVLQQFRNEDVYDPKFREITPYSKKFYFKVGRKLKEILKEVIVRFEGEHVL
ncbi:anaerobic ribonucleoside-triphosphate reductase activating protein [Archaeoglobus profundus]|uniref:Anaerobic ribonucleoside-triphosphate reductase activating protein n=1 Tax=Archaeoglobus profundus (strain DSM 5631 / JCM 9629 / NBRC 100127 / Av18) TaxID=572546 RepID=D2RDZ2_ARCPA|nr:anaerobic ribonucleoside-triphosphate reductase activating protein [Archaeoglobus profundus]ADB58336.1 anaerobic ribonucleoside-triphosphate reductase activating protein [Archaeoglobus profundus DSM 5631]